MSSVMSGPSPIGQFFLDQSEGVGVGVSVVVNVGKNWLTIHWRPQSSEPELLVSHSYWSEPPYSTLDRAPYVFLETRLLGLSMFDSPSSKELNGDEWNQYKYIHCYHTAVTELVNISLTMTVSANKGPHIRFTWKSIILQFSIVFSPSIIKKTTPFMFSRVKFLRFNYSEKFERSQAFYCMGI